MLEYKLFIVKKKKNLTHLLKIKLKIIMIVYTCDILELKLVFYLRLLFWVNVYIKLSNVGYFQST